MLQPALQKAADAFGEKDEVHFGQVNGYKEKAIQTRYEVKGHPSFKVTSDSKLSLSLPRFNLRSPRAQWFAKGSTDASPFYFVHYTGGYEETLIKMASGTTSAILSARQHSRACTNTAFTCPACFFCPRLAAAHRLTSDCVRATTSSS